MREQDVVQKEYKPLSLEAIKVSRERIKKSPEWTKSNSIIDTMAYVR